jgi:hypothetical protein
MAIGYFDQERAAKQQLTTIATLVALSLPVCNLMFDIVFAKMQKPKTANLPNGLAKFESQKWHNNFRVIGLRNEVDQVIPHSFLDFSNYVKQTADVLQFTGFKKMPSPQD